MSGEGRSCRTLDTHRRSSLWLQTEQQDPLMALMFTALQLQQTHACRWVVSLGGAREGLLVPGLELGARTPLIVTIVRRQLLRSPKIRRCTA